MLCLPVILSDTTITMDESVVSSASLDDIHISGLEPVLSFGE